MSRLRESSGDPSGADFQRVLAEVWRAERRQREQTGETGARAGFTAAFAASMAFPAGERLAPAKGGSSLWDAALDWLDDGEEFNAIVEAAAPVEESLQAILAELNLHDDVTLEELGQIRRLYMWRNHPDRHSEAERESATRRVAIANMLLDRAQTILSSRKKS